MLYNAYHFLKQKIPPDTFDLKVVKGVVIENGNSSPFAKIVPFAEIAYSTIALTLGQLIISQKPKTDDEINQNNELQSLYDSITKEGGEVLFKIAGSAAARKDERNFKIFSESFILFSKRFKLRGDGTETPEEEMADLYKEHFQKLPEK